MPRALVLGNGNILICIDHCSLIRDFYYPHVGQENHVNGHRHKIGFWTENKFSWLNNKDWQLDIKYKKETLVTDVKALKKELNLEINMNDVVHHKKNIYLKRVIVKNLENREREIRIFFNQHFNITGANIGDTVYYDPTEKANKSIIYYKGKTYFLIDGLNENKNFDDYATGTADVYNLEGTYIDAQDGTLSRNPIDHGSVDSTISFHLKIKANSKKVFYYWIAVGEKFKEVCNLNKFILKRKPEKLIKETELYWKKWVNKKRFKFFNLDEEIIDLFKRSLLIIKTQADNNGAIIAANDSDTLQFKKDTYSYMWPRDGALVARSLDRAGYKGLTTNFFEFCNKVLTDEGYLFPKYRPDRSLGSSWHSWLKNNKIQLPIQEDQIGLVLDALWKHYKHYKQNKENNFIKKLYPNIIKKAADFLIRFSDKKIALPKESYDLWEERLGIHTFTCCTTYAGLLAASNFANIFGTKKDSHKYKKFAEKLRESILNYLYDPSKETFIKGLYINEKGSFVKDQTIDISTGYGIFEFNILDANDGRVKNTMDKIIEKLLCRTFVGGISRHEKDYYHKKSNNVEGNPWFITTLWLAEYYIKKAKDIKDLKQALDIFNWTIKNAQSTGVLSEQLDPNTGKQISVAPLTWSHGSFVTAVIKYIEKIEYLNKKTKTK